MQRTDAQKKKAAELRAGPKKLVKLVSRPQNRNSKMEQDPEKTEISGSHKNSSNAYDEEDSFLSKSKDSMDLDPPSRAHSPVYSLGSQVLRQAHFGQNAARHFFHKCPN